MKIAFISDAHGNYLALDQVLNHLKTKMSISDIYFLGDAVGYLPDVNNVITRLKKDATHCLMGNHEAMLLGLLPIKEANKEAYKLDIAEKTIDKDNISFIKGLSSSYTISINNFNILMVHGNPSNTLTGYLYEDSDFSNIQTDNYDFIFMGHTHRPFILKKGNVTFVNVGSCGLPRDNGHLAAFAIFDTETGKANIYRLALNTDTIIKEYGSFIHPSVVECLSRNNKYNGELIN